MSDTNFSYETLRGSKFLTVPERGDFIYVEILEWHNQPVFFTARGDDGHLYVVLQVKETREECTWLFIKLMELTWHSYRSCSIDSKEMFLEAHMYNRAYEVIESRTAEPVVVGPLLEAKELRLPEAGHYYPY